MDNSMNNIGGQILGCTDIEAFTIIIQMLMLIMVVVRYAENPLENTNLPIVELVGVNFTSILDIIKADMTIYKSELDEQVSMTDEFKEYGPVTMNLTPINGVTKFEITIINNTTDLSLNLPISETYVMRKN